jgi:hypothetical protein
MSISIKSTITPLAICCVLHAIVYYHVPVIISIPHHQSAYQISLNPEKPEWKTYLWGQVESEITASSELILNQQRNLIGEAELDRLGQTSSFAEVDKVFQGECERDGFGEFDIDVELGLVYIGVAA